MLVLAEVIIVPVVEAFPVSMNESPPVLLDAEFCPETLAPVRPFEIFALFDWSVVLVSETVAEPLLLDPVPFPSLTTPIPPLPQQSPFPLKFELAVVNIFPLLSAFPVPIEVSPTFPFDDVP